MYSTFPEVAESEQEYIKFPSDIEDAKSLGSVLSRWIFYFILGLIVQYLKSNKYIKQTIKYYLCRTVLILNSNDFFFI